MYDNDIFKLACDNIKINGTNANKNNNLIA